MPVMTAVGSVIGIDSITSSNTSFTVNLSAIRSTSLIFHYRNSSGTGTTVYSQNVTISAGTSFTVTPGSGTTNNPQTFSWEVMP